MCKKIENIVDKVKSGDVVIGKPGAEKKRYENKCDYFLFRYKNKSYFTTDDDVFECEVKTKRLLDMSDKNVLSLNGYNITTHGKLYTTCTVKRKGVSFIASRRVKKFKYLIVVIDSVAIGLTIKNDFILNYRNISCGLSDPVTIKDKGTINDKTTFILLGLMVFGINVSEGEIFLIKDYDDLVFDDETTLKLTTVRAFKAKNAIEAFSKCTVHRSILHGKIKMKS